MVEERLDILEEAFVDVMAATNASLLELAKRGVGGGDGGGVKVVRLTLAEYKAMASHDPNTLYAITNMTEDDEARGLV